MVIWLKKDDGSCVRLVDPWKPRIHVCGDAQDLLRLSSEHFVPQACFTEKFERPGDRGVSRCLALEWAPRDDESGLCRTLAMPSEILEGLGGLQSFSRFRLESHESPHFEASPASYRTVGLHKRESPRSPFLANACNEKVLIFRRRQISHMIGSELRCA